MGIDGMNLYIFISFIVLFMNSDSGLFSCEFYHMPA